MIHILAFLVLSIPIGLAVCLVVLLKDIARIERQRRGEGKLY